MNIPNRAAAIVAIVISLSVGATACASSTTTTQAVPSIVKPSKSDPAVLHRWPFDDGSGLSAADTAKQNGTAMELQDGAAWTEGVRGTALALNGNGQEADATLPKFGSAASYSVSAWVRLTHLGDTYQTVVSEEPRDGKSSVFYLQYAKAEHTFAFSFADARAAATSISPRANVWYHLVGVRDAANETLSLYVDGRLAGVAGAPINQNVGSGVLVIGRGLSYGTPVDFVGGAIDDVSVYAKALTATQVAAVYNESAPR